MTDTPLLLGPVAFQGFELPERLSFGGAQRLAVHRLPGGMRVVDTLGRDDADLVWSGVFSGPDAGDRVRLLDAMRAAGEPVPLIWDAFCYTVIIARLDADYRSPWWIPYRIACTVVQDEATGLVAEIPSLAASALADLASAAACGADVSVAQATLAAPGATTLGGTSYSAAIATLSASRAAVESDMAAAESQLGTGDFPSTVATAGRLAQLATARGYVARAAINLANASS